MRLTKTYAQMLNELNDYVQSKSHQAVWEHDAMDPETKAEHIFKDGIQSDITQLDGFVKHLIDNKYDVNLTTYDAIRNNTNNLYANADGLHCYEYVYDNLFYNRNRNKIKNSGYWAEDFAKDDRFKKWYDLFPTWNNIKVLNWSFHQVGNNISNGIVWERDPQYEEDFKDVSKLNEGKRQPLYHGR